MENLGTGTISVYQGGIQRQYEVKERDHGDLVVYDIFSENDYLLTLSAEGEILFMNLDVTEHDKEIFCLAFLRQISGKVKEM